MDIKQKQWQLYFLGYYGKSINDIDGYWGANSIAATEKFQKDNNLDDDGIFGTNTINKSKEVIKTIQKAVKTTVVDGLAGPKTVEATKKFQKSNGLVVDGIAGVKTRAKISAINNSNKNNTNTNNAIDTTINTTVGNTTTNNADSNDTDWWANIKYFKREEFKCKCGGKYCNGYPVEPNRKLVEIAEHDVREYFDAVVDISSGIRCEIHNANCGGVSNSRHMRGTAMDFRVRGKTAAQVLAHVKTIPGIRYCYAINDTYVHMDVIV